MSAPIYIKATFNAHYLGEQPWQLVAQRVDWHRIKSISHVEISDVEQVEAFEEKHVTLGKNWFKFNDIKEAVIGLPGDSFYKVGLQNVIVRDAELYDTSKDGSKTIGKIKGTAYFKWTLPEVVNHTHTTSSFVTEESALAPSTISPVVPSKSSRIGMADAGSGCSSIVGLVLGFLLLGILLSIFGSQLLTIVLLFLGFALISFLLNWLGELLAIAGALYVLVFVVQLITGLWGGQDDNRQWRNLRYTQREEEGEKTRYQEKKSDDNDLPDTLWAYHDRVWNDYEGRRYTGTLRMSAQNHLASQSYLAQLSPPGGSFAQYWAYLYSNISNHDDHTLGPVYSMFDSIQSANSLDRYHFACMVVSCIQDIPYTLITNLSCEEHARQYPNDPASMRARCVGDVQYGVLAPTSFIYTLDGDCDTRSLLLYTVLKHYGYDVNIALSLTYRHAVLGINLPIQTYNSLIGSNSTNYCLWETTARNMPPGKFAPEWSDMSQWTLCF